MDEKTVIFSFLKSLSNIEKLSLSWWNIWNYQRSSSYTALIGRMNNCLTISGEVKTWEYHSNPRLRSTDCSHEFCKKFWIIQIDCSNVINYDNLSMNIILLTSRLCNVSFQVVNVVIELWLLLEAFKYELCRRATQPHTSQLRDLLNIRYSWWNTINFSVKLISLMQKRRAPSRWRMSDKGPSSDHHFLAKFTLKRKTFPILRESF